MASLGFSVERKAPAPRRGDARLRRSPRREENDGRFVLGMIALGLSLLAAGAWHDQARLVLARVAGLF
ncbi:hypothetical protein SAMN06265338_104277 [Rhodoblastus acidophilus]|uniref:Uncharacterized protein n=1 Tax=Rhodoblastus acidophilus TaxID=1074 RepID=A0A212RIJ4_RHOAC|nr:hypothetical protein [Rhodoblastus acidophilus]MCW2317028.1 hypothetical protein [Rhodoblastus acidophilus]PPQ38072.1 hypothetical protein CKO16_11600 [Rhodoblastus acidophilus]RAI16854.1 hypothetical protein CH337_19170 [Rhodoblastus acidophilus]SNB72116.1 hypothetical protein SAMN06265338_104277 [Rhodoblastus acidophilus]